MKQLDINELVSPSDIAMDDTGGAVVNDRISFLLQEIGMLFDTSRGEVLGDERFGTDFEQFIWDLNASNTDISSYVVNAIYGYTTTGGLFDIGAETTISPGTDSDVIIVKITITDPESDSRPVNAIYRIS